MSPPSEPTQSDLSNDYGSISIVHLDLDYQQDSPSRARPRKIGLNPTFGALGLFVLVSAFAIVLHIQGYDAADLSISSTAELVQLEAASSDNDGSTFDPPHYYHHQPVDHFDDKNKDTFTHRYYTSEKHFGGPGYPIFLVLGGEDELLKLLYPFVNDHLAKEFKAFVLEPELRFYGESQPIKVKKNTDLIGLLTSEQAMADALQLLEHIQKELKCSLDRSSKHYCPVITVGGSYPGFLSALLRIAFPDKIDMSYAASAPLHLYAQDVDPNAYFDLVTRVAEQTSEGCASAVRDAVEEARATVLSSNSFSDEATRMGICADHIPDYIQSKEIFARELTLLVGENFADFNMENYPPGADTALAKACFIFQDDSLDIYGTMDHFFQLVDVANGGAPNKCGYDMRTQLSGGANATISGADWTGSGDGMTARSWEFQCCTELIVQTSFSEASMFYPREWTLEWVTEHCQSRFGVDPTPTHLVDKFGFDDLSNSSRIIFTNGLNDGWSASSILKSIPPGIVALNFPNGAHHSELNHDGPSEADTEDIRQGYVQITEQLGMWLDEVKAESKE
jgi:hypothetical protein